MPVTLDPLTGIVATNVNAANYRDAVGGNNATINNITPVSSSVIAGLSRGVILLGTLDTSISAASVTLSGLNLTSYEYLIIEAMDVSHNSGATGRELRIDGTQISNNQSGGVDWIGQAYLFLDNSYVYSWISDVSIGSTDAKFGATTVTRNSTSITITLSGGSFDAGSIKIYGVL